MCMPVGFYCSFCSCFPWEEGEKKRVWKILFFNRDFCFGSYTAFKGLTLFFSDSLNWTPLIFNKQICGNIPNTMSHLLSWLLGHQGLPGMPASVLTMHNESTCWRSSICSAFAAWPCSNSPMPEIPSGKMARLPPNPFSSSPCRYRAKHLFKYIHQMFSEKFSM